jgi:hypothetical protein
LLSEATYPIRSQATFVRFGRDGLRWMLMVFAVVFVLNHRARVPMLAFGVRSTNEVLTKSTPGVNVFDVVPAGMVATPLTPSTRMRPLMRSALPFGSDADARNAIPVDVLAEIPMPERLSPATAVADALKPDTPTPELLSPWTPLADALDPAIAFPPPADDAANTALSFVEFASDV